MNGIDISVAERWYVCAEIWWLNRRMWITWTPCGRVGAGSHLPALLSDVPANSTRVRPRQHESPPTDHRPFILTPAARCARGSATCQSLSTDRFIPSTTIVTLGHIQRSKSARPSDDLSSSSGLVISPRSICRPPRIDPSLSHVKSGFLRCVCDGSILLLRNGRVFSWVP